MKYIYIIIVLFSLISISCTETEKPVLENKKNEKITEIEPDQISYNVSVSFVDSSFTKAILHAGRARVYFSRYETLLDSGVKVEFYSRQSNMRISILTAENARIDDNTRNMLARGNVIVISDSTGSKLETNLLEWNNTTQKIYSTEFVRITSPSEIIEGWGFESDPNLNNYRISKVSGIKR